MAKNKTPFEATEQEKIFEWKQLNQAKYPDLKLLNGSLCGVRLRSGQRMKAKRQGMPKGFPDLFLPVTCYPYSGLFIELKRLKGGVVSQDQKWWIERLKEQGYYAVVAKGHVDAIKAIKTYLGITDKT